MTTKRNPGAEMSRRRLYTLLAATLLTLLIGPPGVSAQEAPIEMPRVAWLKITVEGPGVELRAGSAIELLDYDSGDYQTEHGWLSRDLVTMVSPASDCREYVLTADVALVHALPGDSAVEFLHRTDRFQLGQPVFKHEGVYRGDYRALCRDGTVGGWVRVGTEMEPAEEYEKYEKKEAAARAKEEAEREQREKEAELASRRRLRPAGEAHPLSLQYSKTLYATTTLNLRAGPSTEELKLRTIPAGSAVEVADCESGWCPVSYKGESGWASASYLSATRLQTSRSTTPTPVNKRAVYWELVRVQDRGYCEGKRLLPGNLQRQANHMDKTSREAYQTVARKYGITEQAAKQIAVEGTKANWPIPDSPCD